MSGVLRRAKRKGYIYPPANGWVTFVAEEGVFGPDERIVSAASHPLLHYVSAEDHGWSFALFDHAKLVSGYRCDWDNEITVDDTQYSRAALQQYVASEQASLFDDFESRLHDRGHMTIAKTHNNSPAPTAARSARSFRAKAAAARRSMPPCGKGLLL